MKRRLSVIFERIRKRLNLEFPIQVSLNHGLSKAIALAIVFSGLSTWVRLLIAPVEAGFPYVTYFPAVSLAAVFGGYKSGLIATCIGMTLATYMFIPPYFSFSFDRINQSFWSNLVFLLDGVIVTYSIEAMHRFRNRYAAELHAMQKSEQNLMQYEAIVASSEDAIISMTLEGYITHWNKGAQVVFGYSSEEIVGRHISTLFPESKFHEETKFIEKIRNGIPVKHYEAERVHKNGSRIDISVTISPLHNCEGKVVGISKIARDISEQKKNQLALAKSEQRLRNFFEKNSSVMLIIDPSTGQIVEANDIAAMYYGFPVEVLTEMNISQINSLPPELIAIEMQEAAQEERNYFRFLHRLASGEIRNVEVHSTPIEYAGGRLLLSIVHDITERKRMEERIHQMAFYDTLTRLPNRRLLDDRLEQAIVVCKRNGRYGAVMFLDLDNFKPLNDSHGHKAGDLLLIEVACRLTSCVREVDTVARFGGDEFVVLLSDLSEDEIESRIQARVIAEKIHTTLSQPYWLGGNSADSTNMIFHDNVGASIGVVVFNGSTGADKVLKDADFAMYEAKEGGRNMIKFYGTKSND